VAAVVTTAVASISVLPAAAPASTAAAPFHSGGGPIVWGRRTLIDICRPVASGTKHRKVPRSIALKEASIADFTLQPLGGFAGHSHAAQGNLRG
jgi:hypothetical protein